MKFHPWLIMFAASTALISATCQAEKNAEQACPRPAEGAVVQEPVAIDSANGALNLNLRFESGVDAHGVRRYCYISESGVESPTLRVLPGDRLSIHFQNDLTAQSATSPAGSMAMPMPSTTAGAGCSGVMSEQATNLHFHGLALPPVCHQDESIHTLVGPGQSFDYETRIPEDNSPGLYWYHPHPHGFSEGQVQGGASGALIVDGIDSAAPSIASLPHRTFILRDQLLPPGVPLPGSSPNVDPLTPSWDVSINYVPIRYPKYVPATIQVRRGQRQFWRLVNAAANTIFNLQILYNDVPQPIEIYAIDGVPVGNGPIVQTAVYLPPGARVEFAMTAPKKGESARLVTQKVDSGPTGDSAPARPLANLVVVKSRKGSAMQEETAEAKLRPTDHSPAPDLLSIKPVRTRTLYFSQNGNGTEGGAGAADKFFITVLGQPVKQFDMNAATPNIVVHQGTVEDWNIRNTTPEDHIFHMHQVHFQLIAVNGMPVNDPILRDTIRVPHQIGRTPISSVKLRIDFREPGIVGDSVYHCHILGHEDKGMMGWVKVLPADAP
jgi:FtsP/CotA-like multicopper oxidase with cupredoxin domain